MDLYKNNHLYLYNYVFYRIGKNYIHGMNSKSTTIIKVADEITGKTNGNSNKNRKYSKSHEKWREKDYGRKNIRGRSRI